MENVRNISFSPPDISELEIAEVVDTLRSGWITTGPKVKKVETLIADYVGADKCVCLNSQTAAAELSLRVLGIGAGDEVITCAYTYTASASVIDHVGAKIVLVDCQPDCVEMDYDALERAITEKTKAIIPVDIAGIPCDYERILGIVERKRELFRPATDLQRAIGRVAILGDAAHALGAEWHGRPVGSIADFTNFSFHAVKNFTTAEGGACVWRSFDGIDDNELYHQFQLLSLHGQSKDALAKTQLGAWEYDVVGPWYKCNMTDIMGAIGLGQLQRYPAMLKRRREIIERYDAAFKPLGVGVLPHYTDSYSSCGHLYLTRIPGITTDQRQEIIVEMARRGIACNVHYKPLPLHTAYKNLGFCMEDYPNAYAYFANEITLPLHTRLSDDDVEYIIANYCDILKQYLD